MIIPFNGSFVERIEHKFGINPDIDTASVPADIWDGPTLLYPFPAAVAVTDVRSSDAGDTIAGAGARQVVIEGLRADLTEVHQLIDLDGVTPVALDVDLLRCNRIFAVSGGSNGFNIGTITVQHGATVICQMSPNRGQSLMAVYTLPADIVDQNLLDYHLSIGRTQATFSEIIGQFRIPGSNIWRVFEVQHMHTQGTSAFRRRFDPFLPAVGGADLRITCEQMSSNNTAVTATFDIERSHRRTA